MSQPRMPLWARFLSLLVLIISPLPVLSVGTLLSASKSASTQDMPTYMHRVTWHGKESHELPQPRVLTTYRDTKNMLWVGTRSGLFRYDGHQFLPIKLDPSSMSAEPAVRMIYEDDARTLWVGTLSGLFFINLANDQEPPAKAFMCGQASPCLIHHINAQGVDIILSASGLYRCQRESYQCEPLPMVKPSTKKRLQTTYVTLWLDPNTLVTGGADGVSLWKKNDNLHWISGTESLSDSNKPQDVYDLVKLSDGSLLVAAENGVFKLAIKQNGLQVQRYFAEVKSPQSIALDAENRAWLIADKGIFILDAQDQLSRFMPIDGRGRSLDFLAFTGGHFDTKQQLWLTTDGDGLLSLSKQQRAIQHYFDDPSFPGQSIHPVFSVHPNVSDPSKYWAGQYNAGVAEINASGKVEALFNKVAKWPVSRHITAIMETSQGELWVGSTSGAATLDLKSHTWLPITHEGGSGRPVNAFALSASGHIWQCGSNQINKYLRHSSGLASQTIALTNIGIPPAYCTSLVEWKPGEFLIGTTKGVFTWRLEQLVAKPITLSNEVTWVNGMSLYRQEAWVSTKQGVFKISGSHQVSKPNWQSHFKEPDILQTHHTSSRIIAITKNEVMVVERHDTDKHFTLTPWLANVGFNPGASYLTENNQLLVGTPRGVIASHIDQLTFRADADAAISAFRINENSWVISDQALIDAEQRQFPTINADDVLRLRLTEPTYHKLAQSISYSMPNSNSRRAAYNGEIDLPAAVISQGKIPINFQNQAGEQQKHYRITVNPPWYINTMAIITYGLLIVGIIYSIIWLRHRYIMRKNRWLETKVQEQVATLQHHHSLIQTQSEQLKNLLHQKDELLADVAHELKTPISLITGPMSAIKERITDSNLKSLIQIAETNASRLQKTVEHLIDLEQFNAQPIQRTQRTRISLTTQVIIEHFFSVLSEKGIRLEPYIEPDIFVMIDEEHYEKIITNLLSNAIKYIGEPRLIQVEVTKNSNFAEISVVNTGEPICPEDHSRLFQRFARLNRHRNIQGSGLGLALVKQLVERHDGTITVTTPKINRCQFTVRLPCCEYEPSVSEVPSEKSTSINHALQELAVTQIENISHIDKVETRSEKAYTVLIIEDNKTLNSFMVYCFGWEYNTLAAFDGERGLELAKEHDPDLIITDNIMPGKSGMEICELLRSNHDTLHIPIIMVSALSSKHHKIEAFQKQVDAFIEKPFNIQELMIQAKSLILHRRRLTKKLVLDHIGKESQQSKPLDTLSLEDQKRIESIKHALHENYQDMQFSPNSLADSVGMSRRSLDRHAKRLIGNSASEFIKIYRLNRAAKCIERGDSLSNIAFDVGFSSHSHFSRSFKEYFNKTPSEYRLQHDKKALQDGDGNRLKTQ